MAKTRKRYLDMGWVKLSRGLIHSPVFSSANLWKVFVYVFGVREWYVMFDLHKLCDAPLIATC